ncbi:MAG TPA: AAA family ATPase [Acidimicrobiales bacterium]|nr:AAA family ATPase [Acidimicrobiales bacterium]
MSESDDLRARADSIFERLRSVVGGDDGGQEAARDPGSPPAETQVDEASTTAELAEPSVGGHGEDGSLGDEPQVGAETSEEASGGEAARSGEDPGTVDITTPDGSITESSAEEPSEGAEATAGAQPDAEPQGVDQWEHPGPRSHQLPRRLAIANQKGGVGKTTTAVNLGAALAELGYRVLVVDLDPQGNATTGLGINGRNLDSSIYDVILHDVPIEDVIEPTNLRNLFVVPATIDLAGAEIELVPVFSRELRLRRALENVSQDFDFVLIDCPPSLGLLTVNGLAAAGEVVVPIQCEYYALEGLGQLLRNVSLVQANLNPELEVSTIVLTMYDARTRLAEQVVDEVRQHFGDIVCRNVVPRTVRLSEAPSFGQPIIVFDSSSRGSIAYRELAKEVSGGAPQRVR